MGKSVFDILPEKYDLWYEKNKLAYLSEVEAIKRVFPEGGKSLEVGVGSGRFASPLNIEYGIDLSLNLLLIAQKRGVKVVLGSAESLPFIGDLFDSVLICVSICFFKNPEKALSECNRVLKKGGNLTVAFVDKESFLGKFYLQKKEKSVFYKDARFFSVLEVVEMLEKSGFKDFNSVQTLFDFPENLKKPDTPLPGYGKGGFVVVSAKKG